MLLQSPVYLPKKKLSFSHYAIFEQRYSRTSSYPSGRSLQWQTGKASIQPPLPTDRKFLPLFTTILSVKIVLSCTNKGCWTILSVL